jgi:hypothetical protein
MDSTDISFADTLQLFSFWFAVVKKRWVAGQINMSTRAIQSRMDVIKC